MSGTGTGRRILAIVVVAIAAVAGLAGCAGSDPQRAAKPPPATGAQTPAAPDRAVAEGECGRRPTPPPVYDHVVWIFLENRTYGQVIGGPEGRFETGLAGRCGTATRYAMVGSPSMPNYIGATSGDTHGIGDDAPPASHPLTADNLFRQVRGSGRQARSYQEAMPTNCALESSGTYAVKHNPAAYYTGGDDRRACQADDVALGTPDDGPLAAALDTDTLPAFSLITPDLCNDTHDCPVSAGDAWLEGWIPRIVASTAYRSGTTAVFVVWDEYTPMPFIAVSPSTPAGTASDAAFDHYSLLRTTEEMLGIDELLGRATTATSMRGPLGV